MGSLSGNIPTFLKKNNLKDWMLYHGIYSVNLPNILSALRSIVSRNEFRATYSLNKLQFPYSAVVERQLVGRSFFYHLDQ